MHCGQMLGQPAPMPTGGSGVPIASGATVPAAPAKRAGWAGVLLGVLLTAAAIFGLNAAGILKLQGRTAQRDTLKSSGSQPEINILPSSGSQATPNITPASATSKLMPKDVRDWLEHLERIEKRRVSLATKNLGQLAASLPTAALGMSVDDFRKMAEEDPVDSPIRKQAPALSNVASDSEKIRASWRSLTAEFAGFPPPDECRPLSLEYDQVLRETGAMVGDILGATEKAGENPQEALATLFGMMRKSSKRIDDHASQSDAMVQRICDKYDTRKWFDIVRDVGGGGLTSLGF